MANLLWKIFLVECDIHFCCVYTLKHGYFNYHLLVIDSHVQIRFLLFSSLLKMKLLHGFGMIRSRGTIPLGWFRQIRHNSISFHGGINGKKSPSMKCCWDTVFPTYLLLLRSILYYDSNEKLLRRSGICFFSHVHNRNAGLRESSYSQFQFYLITHAFTILFVALQSIAVGFCPRRIY